MTIYSLDFLLQPVCCSMSSSNCCFLTCIQISQEAGQWSGIPISLRIFHSLLWFTQTKALALSMKQQQMLIWNSLFFSFYDSMDVGNLISGSSAFSKSSLSICKFSVHVLWKPGLENFEHYFARVWSECSCAVVWTLFGIAFLWDWNMKTDLFQSCGHCWVFHICWHIKCSTFTASSFRIWNSSVGIPCGLYVVDSIIGLLLFALWYSFHRCEN